MLCVLSEYLSRWCREYAVHMCVVDVNAYAVWNWQILSKEVYGACCSCVCRGYTPGSYVFGMSVFVLIWCARAFECVVGYHFCLCTGCEGFRLVGMMRFSYQ